MKITKEHILGMIEAKKRIENFLSELIKKDFPGVKIQDPKKSWRSHNLMVFSFRVKRGLISAKIEGTIEVLEKQVTLAARPSSSILNTLIDENKIKEIIESKANELLAP